MTADLLSVRVASITPEALGVIALELLPVAGELPPFTAGAHIDLHLAPGLVRSYSLMNPPSERHRYVIAVQRETAGRGGSAYVHDRLQRNDVIAIGAPRNNFALDESAAHSVLIGGGIGVTPLVSMAARLEALGRSWRMHYCARTRAHAAARTALAPHGDKVRFNFDQEDGGRMLDLAALVADAPPGTHFYCCGPLPMLAAFERAMSGRRPSFAHVEYFSAPVMPAGDTRRTGGFAVTLARSGRTLQVPAGSTILDTLQDAGVDVAYSCMEGVCGSCETAVLEGVPDHHDLVLSADEKAAGTTMMICCSGCKGDRLVLDI
jgi:vanillate O-demethylase ferredoxin subunit